MEDKFEQLKSLIPTLDKLLKRLVFKNVDIKYRLSLPREGRTPHIICRFYIEVDKLYKGSPTYNERYKQVVSDLDFSIVDASKYIGLSRLDINNVYEYIEKDYVESIVLKCHEELQKTLVSQYELDWSTVYAYDFSIQLFEDYDYISDLRIVAWCSNLDEGYGLSDDIDESGLDCDKVENIVQNILEKNGVTESEFNLQMGICESY